LPERFRQLARDKLSLKPEHAIPRAPELFIPAHVSAHALGVIASINLDDQPRSWSQEINDEAEHGYLATKLNAELLRQEARGLPSLALSVARSHPNGSQSARLRPNGIAKIPIAW
jgi:hypothetical protein